MAFDSSIGFRLPDDSVRSPDASLVAPERWRALSGERLHNLGDPLHLRRGREELTAFLTLAVGEFPQEVLINSPEGIELQRCGDLGDALKQLRQQLRREQVQADWQHPSQPADRYGSPAHKHQVRIL